jgi:hypothetical protein
VAPNPIDHLLENPTHKPRLRLGDATEIVLLLRKPITAKLIAVR